MSNNKHSANIIETNGLTKKYGTLTAVDHISISVQKGEVYGFLGLNGAGKTTTIRMLLGMIHPDAGEVFISGKKIKPGKSGPWDTIGYLVEIPYSYPELTVKENLQAVCKLRRINTRQPVEEIIKFLRLTPYQNVRARNLSLGNNQRLGLAKALIHKPEVLILDEPSNGLDPAGIVEIRELIKDFAFNRNITIFISSHNLGEITKLATRIGIIHNGRLIQELDSDRLDTVLDKNLLLDVRNRKAAYAYLTQKEIKADYTYEGLIKITDPQVCRKPEEINQLLVQAGFPPFYLSVEQEDLEAYFLRIIGEKND